MPPSLTIVHPKHKSVIPLCPEAIRHRDGNAKNDCEHNAAKRLIARTRREHPHLKFLVVENELASNGPHMQELEKARMRYISGAKEGVMCSGSMESPTRTRPNMNTGMPTGVSDKYSFVNRVLPPPQCTVKPASIRRFTSCNMRKFPQREPRSFLG